MNKVKIYTHGADHVTCQLPRIKDGFIVLGHEITPNIEDADLIYSNNPWWDDIINAKRTGKVKGKIIFNILDLCPHCQDFPMDRMRAQILEADTITVISETVKKDCLERLNPNLNYNVIYQPKMGVHRTEVQNKLNYKVLFTGRINDFNKRSALAIRALSLLGYKNSEVAVCGTENGGFGSYLGVLDEEKLNALYNSVDFVVCTSLNEGICLPMIEAAACGAIPIICKDMSTREEFFPSSLFPEYLEVEPNPQSIAKFISRFSQDNDAKEKFKQRLHFHFLENLEINFNKTFVASKILEIYNKI
jgi:glycosyltransferase involved in cell wall biosynthesis